MRTVTNADWLILFWANLPLVLILTITILRTIRLPRTPENVKMTRWILGFGIAVWAFSVGFFLMPHH